MSINRKFSLDKAAAAAGGGWVVYGGWGASLLNMLASVMFSVKVCGDLIEVLLYASAGRKD